MWGNSLTIQIVFAACVEHCGAAVTLLMLIELTRLVSSGLPIQNEVMLTAPSTQHILDICLALLDFF